MKTFGECENFIVAIKMLEGLEYLFDSTLDLGISSHRRQSGTTTHVNSFLVCYQSMYHMQYEEIALASC